MITAHGTGIKRFQKKLEFPSECKKNVDQKCVERHASKGAKEVVIDTKRATEYLSFFRQFALLKLYDKREYIKNRAPEKFIEILRECVSNAMNGTIPCNESLVSSLQNKYSCQRISDFKVSHQEARCHLCGMKLIQLLLPVFIGVVNYLS